LKRNVGATPIREIAKKFGVIKTPLARLL